MVKILKKNGVVGDLFLAYNNANYFLQKKFYV